MRTQFVSEAHLVEVFCAHLLKGTTAWGNVRIAEQFDYQRGRTDIIATTAENTPGTPLDALPAAPPLTAARSPDRPADPPPPPPAPSPSVQSFAAPLPPPAPRPRSLSVRYDGSDDDDNDPDWKRIG